MKVATASLILLCLVAGARAQQAARQLWELKTDGKLTWAAFSPDGKLVAASYGDKTTVRLWDAQTGELRTKLTGHDDPVRLDQGALIYGRVTIAPAESTFSPDGRLLAVAARAANEVRLWDVQAGKRVVTLRGLSSVREVRFDPSGRILAVAAGDQGLQLLDVAAGAMLNARWKLKGILSVNGLWFPPDGKTIGLITTSLDSPRHSCYVVDMATGEVRARIGDKRDDDSYIAYVSKGAQEFATTNERGQLSLWDAASGRVKWTLKVRRKGYPFADFAPFARSVAVLNEDGAVEIWDGEKGRVTATLPEKEKVRFVAYTEDAKGLLITVTGRGVGLWDAETLEPRLELPGARLPLTFSRDGTRVLTAADGNRAVLWDVTDVRR